MSSEMHQWYILHSYSGYEKKVKEALEQRFEANGCANMLKEILIPTEPVQETKNGKKVITEKKLFPGYIYVHLQLTDDTWHIVKNTPRVTGFVGGRTPPPLLEEEINAIKNQMRIAQEKPKPKISFGQGEKVKIVEGPFSNFIGSVDEVNHEKGTLKVMVTIFGRSTPVELNFHQVEKT
jgi:transcriptional antiterminator NusG